MSQAKEAVGRPGEPPAERRFSRGQIWLLIGVSALIAFVYGILAAVVLGRRTEPEPGIRAVETVESLKLAVARERALALASGWQPDAQLVGVNTSWQLAAGDELTFGRPTWSFRFYSPAARQIQIVMVDKGGARALRQVAVRAAPSPVEADWDLGSQDLMLIFLAYGGKEYLARHANASVHFYLKREGDGRSTWYLSGLDPVARQSFVVGVDALSREVVFHRQGE